MLDIATRRADAQGITNCETTVCSADDLPFGDATSDSISVRFGYMSFPDLAKAAAEFARVLKPGGRLCSSVWAGPGKNPWTAIAMQAIATEAVLAPPDPDERIAKAVIAKVSAYEEDGEVRIPGIARCIAGTK